MDLKIWKLDVNYLDFPAVQYGLWIFKLVDVYKYEA